MTYCGRTIFSKDIKFIKNLINKYSTKSRRFISQELCRQWDWKQKNGCLKDMSCRGLLLKLERAGYIIQPPRKVRPNNPFINRTRPQSVDLDRTPITGSIKELHPITVKSVRRTPDESLYNALLEDCHYLKYAQPVGENLKYLAYANNRPLACLGWMSAPWYIECRDAYIGWSKEERERNLQFIAYNTRYLIVPWVKVKNFASFLLGLIAKRISNDWQRMYHHPIHYLETFIDIERGFKGSCYKAANWQYLGKTKGRGRLSTSSRKTESVKAVYGYPLRKEFREILCR